MKKQKVLLLGLGNFGHSWAEAVIPACADRAEFVAAVDQRAERFSYVPEGVPCYTDLDTALSETHPDLVVNVTPPTAHTDLNDHLLALGYAVLCEKPIAGDLDDAMRMDACYAERGGFLMIADNYRYSTVFRKARAIIASGELGAVHAVQCHFRHWHPDHTMFYHGRLAQPLLTDVTIHHLDVARYLTGAEAERVLAETWSAPYAWYAERPANAAIRTWMTGHVPFHYFGTLAAPSTSSDWNGDWDIECDKGVLRIRMSRLYVYDTEEGAPYEVPLGAVEADSRIPMLVEALDAVAEGRKGETDLVDNLKTFRWMQAAVTSAEQQCEVCPDTL